MQRHASPSQVPLRARLALVAAVVLAGSCLAPSAAHAESSSWSSRVETQRGPAAPGVAAPKAAATPPGLDRRRELAPAKPKAEKAAPMAPPGLGQPAARTVLPYEVPPPAPGTESAEAAYAMLDQGRFLTALQVALKAVEKGDKEAYTLIGRIYEEGLGVPRDDAVASEWYAQGAEKGDANAQFALGLMYAEGRGVAKNLARAGTAFEAAAKQGHPIAQYNLGLLYAHGDGRDESFAQSAYWLEKAAVQGHVPAQYDLGTLYYEGRGVEASNERAAEWIGKAAQAGHASALLDFAAMLAKGEGVAKDGARAFKLIRLAAEKGNAVAQNRLARFYFYGVETPADPVEGAKWHLIARRAGAVDGRLDLMLAKLGTAERAAAEKAASEWTAKVALQ